MKCKPGDLAILIVPAVRHTSILLGAPVTVVKLNEKQFWVLQEPLPFSYGGMTFTVVSIADECLMPISGPLEEETTDRSDYAST